MERERSAYKTSSKVSGKTNTNVSSPHEMRLNLRLLKEGHKGMRLTVQICSGKSGEAASACCGKVHPSSPTPESASVLVVHVPRRQQDDGEGAWKQPALDGM